MSSCTCPSLASQLCSRSRAALDLCRCKTNDVITNDVITNDSYIFLILL